MSRRTLLLAGLATPALAQAPWAPTRPVRMLCGYPPGGTTDITARLAAEGLTRRLGQPVTVENRPGATGNIAMEQAARAEPDGHTIICVSAAEAAMNYTLFADRDPVKPTDFVQLGLMMQVPNAIFCHPSQPFTTLAGMLAWAKAHPGALNYGSTSLGGTPHLSMELLKLRGGVDLLHVPFRGAGPMLAEAIAGRVQLGCDNLPSCIGHLRDGRLRALAVTTPQRSKAMPDVPSVAETLPGYAASGWFGLQGPARMPPAAVARYGPELEAITQEAPYRARLAELGAELPGLTPEGGTTPAAFAAFVTAEIGKWAEVVRASGVRVE